MQLKDKTSVIGRVGLLIPLILIFLTVADSAFACPGHKTGVAYRTRAINTRTVSYTPTTVIAYRAPASYRRCGANVYDTRGARYVAMRGSGTRYVAVRNDDAYAKLRRTQYVAAVRNVEPRYVAVRHRYPIYRISDTKYAEIRSGYRTGNGVVRYIDVDDDDEPRYVAVRRVAPSTRYVAVRNIDYDDDASRYVAVRTVTPRSRYVAVRNINAGCTPVVALRSCLDKLETTSARRVVLREDDDDVSTKHVVLRDDIDDDDTDIIKSQIDDDDDVAYIAVPSRTTTKYLEYSPAAYSHGMGATYIAANDFANTCSQPVAVRTCRPEAVSTRTIAYEVSDDDDADNQVLLREGGATYVASGDMDDACLSRQVVYTRPNVVTTRAVSFVPIEDVDEDTSLTVSEPTYVVNKTAVSQPRWVALDADERFDDLDPTWVREVEDTGLGTVSYVPGGDVKVGGVVASYMPVDDVEEMEAGTVSYVPVADTSVVETVNSLPIDEADVVETGAVSYVPVDDVEETQTLSNLPVSSVREVAPTYIAADACPTMVSSVDAESVSVAGASTVLVSAVDDDLVAGMLGTKQVAARFGYRDGFADGKEAALEGDLYHPENSGDYEKATEGYEDAFGDKDVYKDGYRKSYLAGYRAGFESVDNSA